MARGTVKGIDLNLVPLLQVLLEVRNVSRAAEQLQISQPAASTGLARLRRHFDDELLLRVGRKYELTPFAQSLVPLVDETMHRIHRMSGARSGFDPSTTGRSFVVAASDYAATLLVGPLRRILQDEAPGVAVEFVPTSSISGEVSEFSRMDLLIAPAGYGMPGLSRQLFRDSFVAIVAADNPILRQSSLTLERFASLPHAVGFFGEGIRTPADKLFEQAGLKRNVAAVANGFLALPLLVEGTDLVATVPRMLAARAQQTGAIAILELPLDLEAYLVEAMFWHPTQTDDPASTWLRSVVRRSSTQLQELFQPKSHRLTVTAPSPGLTARSTESAQTKR
ncbi:LysR family transcriptional regulator [Arthrobacter sp. NtRootA1]|uniref:LysR family transcriptional regulator n=1 Tax=Arthrobacter sp. NtRootA1 TaxID=2830983 RepID=UPI001CC57026|nr:LysR family transcriptional regulator [Arthrobacter sp. NtRootA1]BCW05936.1 LysR family transcriptional regulator [Arthrobacter sp. NtRootA1]